MTRPIVVIYTDGGCEPNPGRGGWAYVLIDADGTKREDSGGDLQTTNNRMELTAAIMALNSLTEPSVVVLHSDSKYLIDGARLWMENWRRTGWKGGSLPNADLWKIVDKLKLKHQIDWKWVRGHSGNKYNERCDRLATAQIRGVPVDELETAPEEPVRDMPNSAGGGMLTIVYQSPEQRDRILALINPVLRED